MLFNFNVCAYKRILLFNNIVNIYLVHLIGLVVNKTLCNNIDTDEKKKNMIRLSFMIVLAIVICLLGNVGFVFADETYNEGAYGAGFYNQGGATDSSGGDLTNTGEPILIIVSVAAILIGLTIFISIRRRKKA